MKIESFDRSNLPVIRDAMNTALASLESQFGIKIIVGNASFSPDNATFKIQIATIGDGGVVQSKERTAFELYAPMYELDPKMLDQKIIFNGTEYTIVGFNSRRQKYPVLGRRADGKTFCLNVDGVKSAWLRKQPVTINPPVIQSAQLQPITDEE